MAMLKSTRSAEKVSFWRLAVAEFAASGMTVRAFCAREGLSEPSFYGWRRKLRQQASAARAQPSPAANAPALIPVAVVAAADATASRHPLGAPLLELVTPGGFTLRFPPDIEPQQLSVLLSVVARGKEATPC
jgi:transposase-like protein